MPKLAFAPRGATKGIRDSLPLELPYLLFDFVDAQLEQGLEMDYLQIFELSVREANGQKLQYVVHRQEQPKRRTKYMLKYIPNPINLTVWIVDEATHAIIMLPEEY
ncbi:DUF960 family protein [Paenibacillus sp. FSL R7-0189]|uniref:DUF960 family protein n=1 Tax=Paenibacillus sp. FSL R7-0189 TaxID=2921673 RepID=UPI0030DD4E56